MSIQFTAITTDTVPEKQVLTVFITGRGLLPPVDDTHPNFEAIKDACYDALDGVSVDEAKLVELFDVAKTVATKFERLSDRVSVKNGTILVDGDPIHGTLQEQILQFLDAGEEFGPLVEFYEKLLTNPLGDVRDGLYDWVSGQRAEGNFTITPDGNVLGYKAVEEAAPEWRKDEETIYRPSRRGTGVVNGRDVGRDEYIEQVPGDVVEMPRSRVLHEPSQACGDGLHIGTYAYAKGFLGARGTVMLVEFSPRDIVSLPDSNATWKLRVCRYKVIAPVEEPLDVPLYSPQGQEEPTVEYGCHGWEDEPDVDLTLGLSKGDRVEDLDFDRGTVIGFDGDGDPVVQYDDTIYGEESVPEDELTRIA